MTGSRRGSNETPLNKVTTSLQIWNFALLADQLLLAGTEDSTVTMNEVAKRGPKQSGGKQR